MLELPDFTTRKNFQRALLIVFIASLILSAFFAALLYFTTIWPSGYRPWLMLALIAWIAVAITLEVMSLIIYFPRGKYLDKPADLRLILSILWVVCFISAILFQNELLYYEDGRVGVRAGFWHARAEFFTIFLAFLAIIGFIYALYAKKVADSVFSATAEIHKSMSAFFRDFEDVTNPNNPRSALGLVKSAKKSIIFYLGPPLIGYFRKRDFGVTLVNTVSAKLNDASDPLPSGFSIKLICWGDEMCHEYIDASNRSLPNSGPAGEAAKKPIDGKKKPIDEKDFTKKKNDLFYEIERISQSGGASGEVAFYPAGFDPPIRFVIADGRRAIVWILENPTAEGAAEERKNERYAAAGFATDDPYMIKILEGVYRNAPRPKPDEPQGNSEIEGE